MPKRPLAKTARTTTPKTTTPNVEKTRPLTLQLEVRTAGLRIPNPIRPQGSVDLGVLVEIFSRPPDPKESRYTAMSRSFTLAGLETP